MGSGPNKHAKYQMDTQSYMQLLRQPLLYLTTSAILHEYMDEGLCVGMNVKVQHKVVCGS